MQAGWDLPGDQRAPPGRPDREGHDEPAQLEYRPVRTQEPEADEHRKAKPAAVVGDAQAHGRAGGRRLLRRGQELRQPARSSSATHSMCGVWGNMSTGRTRVSAQPASVSWAA